MLMVSIIMLAMPVTPHHHHANGDICLRQDIDPDDIHAHQNGNPGHHDEDPCCHDICMTRIHTLLATLHIDWAPQHTIVVAIFDNYTVAALLSPQECTLKRNYVYIEALHSTDPTNQSSLRAPPASARVV
jgi:hypothetical protein